MHKIIIFIMPLILAVTFACEKKVDIAAEEEAIKVVLQQQLDAVKAFSYEGEAAVWAHEPYVMKVSEGKVTLGWDSLSVVYKKSFEEAKKDPENYKMREFTALNFEIYLNGNVAFVFHDQHYDHTWEGKEYSGVSRSVKYLEKKEGKWKIVAVFPQP